MKNLILMVVSTLGGILIGYALHTPTTSYAWQYSENTQDNFIKNCLISGKSLNTCEDKYANYTSIPLECHK